jgi:hypothetical protein
LKKVNNFTGLNHLKIWQGDLQQTIKDAIKEKKLDDWLVSMSICFPQVRYTFLCKEELVESNHLKIASTGWCWKGCRH